MQNQEKTRFERRNRRKNLFKFENEKSTGYLENRHLLRKAVKHTPWLISASAAWLALFPCGLAFAEDPNPPLDNTNTKYDIKGETAGATISGGRLSVSSVDTTAVWYVIANWAAAGNAVDGQTTLPDGAIIGQSSTAHVWYAVGSYAPNGTANLSSVSATNATIYGDIIGGDGSGGSVGNTVTVTGTTVDRSLIGGRTQDNIGENDASVSNSVFMSASTAYEVRGGYTLYGNAINNKVFLEANSNVLGFCGGGYTSSGKADSNEVHLNNSSASMILGGGDFYFQKGDVLNNIVTLENGSNAMSVYGGFTLQGNADGNKVKGSDSSISFAVYGGWGTTGASNNKVELDNVNVSGTVTGGKTDSGTASGNEVVLSSGTTFRDTLYAGYTQLGDAIDNNLTLTDISVESQDIYSSFTENGQAGGNVTLSNSHVRNVYGAETESGAANGSTVKGTVSTIDGKVYGGHGTTGASSNTVDLDNVQVTGSVSGGYTDSGDASDNAVTLSNGTTFTGDLYAGYTENGNATGNALTLSGITAPGSVRAGYTLSGNASGTVTITDSTITDDVYGGYTESGTANNSSVTIIDSTISDSTVNEYSIGSSVYAGYTRSGESSYNQVTVSGSNTSIQGRVYGGYGSLDTSHNIVELSEGAYVGDDVVGAHSAGDSATSQNVLYNEVTVHPAAVWKAGSMAA